MTHTKFTVVMSSFCKFHSNIWIRITPVKTSINTLIDACECDCTFIASVFPCIKRRIAELCLDFIPLSAGTQGTVEQLSLQA